MLQTPILHTMVLCFNLLFVKLIKYGVHINKGEVQYQYLKITMIKYCRSLELMSQQVQGGGGKYYVSLCKG